MKPRTKRKEVFHLGQPPKNYRKHRSIGLFQCRPPRLECTEILRASLSRQGDVYVLPHVDRISDFHVSHHQSGVCHWTDEGKHTVPRDGHEDMANAFSLKLFFDCARSTPCVCLRKGKSLSRDDVRNLVLFLAKYIPFRYDLDEMTQRMMQSGFARFETLALQKKISHE